MAKSDLDRLNQDAVGGYAPLADSFEGGYAPLVDSFEGGYNFLPEAIQHHLEEAIAEKRKAIAKKIKSLNELINDHQIEIKEHKLQIKIDKSASFHWARKHGLAKAKQMVNQRQEENKKKIKEAKNKIKELRKEIRRLENQIRMYEALLDGRNTKSENSWGKIIRQRAARQNNY